MAQANKIVAVPNRVERAKALLLSQFKDKPNINAIVEALVEELQEFDDGIVALQTARTLEGSFGVWLDEIGNQAKVSRNGQSDPDYKTAIKISQVKKTMGCTQKEIEEMVSLITGDTDCVVTNNSPYMMELAGYLFCVADNESALSEIADMFPLNTRVRLLERGENRFMTGTVGKGLGSGAKLDSLRYVRQGNYTDNRFTVTANQIIPPPINVPVSIVSNPVLIGNPYIGEVLTCSTGIWNGDTPITYTYQWYINGVVAPSQTTSTYTIQSGQDGNTISCQVIATNSTSVGVAFSNSVAVVVNPTPASTIVDGLGLLDYITTNVAFSSPATNITKLIFKTTGIVEYWNNNVKEDEGNFLSVTGSGAAANYSVAYSLVDGSVLEGLSPNTYLPLTSDVVVYLSVTSRWAVTAQGQYLFTIKKNDNSEAKSKQIYLSSNIESIL